LLSTASCLVCSDLQGGTRTAGGGENLLYKFKDDVIRFFVDFDVPYQQPRRAGAALSSSIGLSARRTTPRSPDGQASLERRRRQAMSGAVPAPIAARFTLGELAVLSVIARQCQRGGVWVLPIDAIAALAGVSRTTTQNALRQARARGLVEARERRRRGLPSLTNIIKVTDKSWSAWLKLNGGGGGLKNLSPTINEHNLMKRSGVINSVINSIYPACTGATRRNRVIPS